MELSERQREAVMHGRGPALCVAGPGSGKTMVITKRVKALVSSGVRPENILVVTFAKAAARQMEARYIGDDGKSGVVFSTIHSLCYSIINSDKKGADRLIPDDVRRGCLKKLFYEYKKLYGSRGGSTFNEGVSRELSMELSCFKSSGRELKKYDTRYTDSEIFSFVAPRYESFLLSNRFYDFDDMTGLALNHLSEKKEAAAFVKRFRYILADEFQDTSIDQLKLLVKVSPHGNLFCVGDDDQSVYSFRGASPAVLDSFKQIYPNSRTYYLTDNYRCVPRITRAAGRIISNNKNRFLKDIRSVGESVSERDGVSVRVFDTEYEELSTLAKYAAELGGENTFAILTRTNFEAELAAAILMRHGVRFYFGGSGLGMFEQTYVRMIMSFIRLGAGAATTEDGVNVARLSIPSVPTQVVSACEATDIDSFFGSLADFVKYDACSLKTTEALRGKLNMLKGMKPELQVMFIRSACGLDEYYKALYKESSAEYEMLSGQADAFFEFAKSFSTVQSLLEYEKRSRLQEKQIIRKGDERISIMTMHSSKGLEFDRVWILNVNEGMIPFKRAVDAGNIEEERRIFYVAMTRARHSLIISAHKSFGPHRTKLSRFISELGDW